MRAAVATLLLTAATGLSQPVYSWTDAAGVEHFTDDASSIPKSARVKRVSEAEVAEQPVREAKEPPPVVKPKATDSSVAAHVEDAEMPEGLRPVFRLAIQQLRGPPTAAAFVELAETTKDPKVLAVALLAVRQLHTSRTSVTDYTFKGKKYPSVPANERVFRLGLAHLDHPDRFVRSGAANVVGLGVARMPPNEQLLKALGERFSVEPDAGVREMLLQELWRCHCARRPMVDSAIWFVEQKERASRLHGLTVMRKVGKKGRDFDAEMRGLMRRAAEEHLDDPSPELRAAAEAAAKANAPK